MTYVTKENIYELLENFERLYPEAAAAFRVAVSEMPEAWITRNDEISGVRIYSHKTGGKHERSDN